MGVLQNGWFIGETPMKMDDLGVISNYSYFWKPPYMCVCDLCIQENLNQQ